MKGKLLTVVAVAILIWSAVAVGSALGTEHVKLAWDMPEGPYDGVRIYQKIGDGSYSAPLATEEYPDGNIPAGSSELMVVMPGEENSVSVYSWVARAYLGEVESDDSNEVSYIVVNTIPLTPGSVTAEYDLETNQIVMSWDQPTEEYMPDKWVIEYQIGEGAWTPIGDIPGGTNDFLFETPFDLIGDGEYGTVNFRVVAYRRSGVQSEASQTLPVEIDRRIKPPIPQLNIEVPTVIE